MLIVLFTLLCHGILSAKAENQVIKIGVYENAPKIFISESGSPAGIFIDIIEHIAEKEGWNLQYISGTWGEGLDRLAKGEIDLMPDVAYNSARETIYAFHKTPVLSSWYEVYARKGSKILSLLDLNQKRILVLDRSVQQGAFVRLSQGFGLTCSLIAVPDYKTMFEMVSAGEADAAITNRFYGKMHAKKHGLENTAVLFEPSDLFYAATREDTQGDAGRLLDIIDQHLEELKNNHQSIYYASIKRWTSEEVRLKIPFYLQVIAIGGIGLLLMSLGVSALLRHQVYVRTRELLQKNAERQAAQQRLMDIIEFLANATFVIDQDKKIIAWNRACEIMTGIKKEILLGQNNYAYAEPFVGERRPILIDLLDESIPEVEVNYRYIQRKGDKLYAESFIPHLRDGHGAYLLGVASPLYDQNGERSGAIETVRDITEQKLVEEALRISEREYRELVMLANSIIMRWSPEGRITFLNEFGQRFFGYRLMEITGRHLVGTIVPETEGNGRDMHTLINEISKDPQKFERNTNENILRDGKRVWIDWTNKVVLDEHGEIKEILSIGSDITDRKLAEEQVQRLHDYLRRHADTLEQQVALRTAELAAINDEQRTVFESAGTGIVLLRDRVIMRCNRKMEEISGYSANELVGQSTRIWYPNEESYIAGGRMVFSQLSKGETFRQEQQMVHKDGSLYWVRLSLRTFDRNAPFKGAVGIVEDITEERQAAEKLREAMEEAQAADHIKSAFLATMSHELRTPLNSIIGFTGIMLQGLTGPLNHEQQKQMTMVQNSSRHLLSLINDVLDISKIEAGQLVFSYTSFDLRSSVDKIAALVAPLAEKKNIELQVDLPDIPVTITTDERRLEQVILNLMNNAIKFTEIGHVGVTLRSEKENLLLSFTDTGIGIQRQDLANLFQPFRQIDSGLARKREGTGLGLSICKKILDLMGGSIEVQSQWKRGSTFIVRIPHQQEKGAECIIHSSLLRITSKIIT
ncbi:MAG: PAS domain S-box protein [Desulforhopalus sp.]